MKKLLLLMALAAFTFAFVWACETPDDSASDSGQDSVPASTEITVTGPIGSDVGKGVPWFTAWEDLSKRGYVEEEFFFEGEATSYHVDGRMGKNGKRTVVEGEKAPYKTRLLVRRPDDAGKFNGTVVVEWLNVSGGIDAAPGWMFNAPFLMREGYVWVGVSAQEVGVQGGMSMLGDMVQPLVKWDPERYGTLTHPGDAYSYDIYSIAARVIKGEGSEQVLGGLKADQLLAYGESQSAFTMITYTNALQPLHKVYDGIFIHSRSALAVPLEGQGSGGPRARVAQVRTDLDVPVIQFETETDVTGFYKARQRDTRLIRTWEVPGTAHADQYLISRIAEAEVKEAVPEQASMLNCEDGNKGPQYILLRAAIKGLDQWAKGGAAPPTADPLKMDGRTILKDEHGNALGGVRTPHVDVPIATYKPTGTMGGGGCNSEEVEAEPGGCGAEAGEEAGCGALSMMCGMFGSTEYFSEEKLLELYPTHEDYVAKVKASTEAVVKSGFFLEEEAEEVIAEAEAAAVPN